MKLPSSTTRTVYLIAFVIVLIAFVIRFLSLDAFINVDAASKWFFRTEHFWKSLFGYVPFKMESGHPGMTLMWLSGISMIIANFFSGFPILDFTSRSPDLILAAKIPIALVSSLTIGVVFVLLYRITGRIMLAFLPALFLFFDPLYLELSRNYHLDALFASFCITSILLAYRFFQKQRLLFLLLSSVFTALTVLTRSTGLILLLFFALSAWIFRKQIHNIATSTITWLSCFFLVIMLLMPHIFIIPQEALYNIFHSVFKSVVHAHNRVYAAMNSELMNRAYYPFYLLFRMPLFYVTLSVFSIIIFSSSKKLKSIISLRHKYFIFFLTSFLIFFLCIMILASKQGGRYILPVFLSADILLGFSVYYIFSFVRSHLFLKRFFSSFIVVFVVLFGIQNYFIFRHYPYYQTYYNALFPLSCSYRIPQYPHCVFGWGEGVELAAEYFETHFSGNLPSVFISYNKPGFRYFYDGETRGRWTDSDIDFFLFYKSIVDRGFVPPEFSEYLDTDPFHVIEINSIPYIYIYKNKNLVGS